MKTDQFSDSDWKFLLSMLPQGLSLDETARECRALVLPRVIRSAETLLRLVFAYACCGLSLQDTCLWAAKVLSVDLSKVALRKRLIQSVTWLDLLLKAALAERVRWLTQRDLRLRLVDATTVPIPGSQGTDWRVHMGFDLGSLSIDALELTGPEGGESYSRFKVQEKDVMIGDRGYVHRQGLWSIAQSGAYFLVRLTWQTLPLQDVRGERFDLLDALRQGKEDEAIEFAVQTAAKGKIPALPARLVILRKSAEAAEESRRKLFQVARKKRRTVDPRTLEAAAYIFVLTSVPAEHLSTAQVLEVYRLRWQIEMAFKRFKQILPLRRIPAKDPELAKTYLYANLLAALLTEDLARDFLAFPP